MTTTRRTFLLRGASVTATLPLLPHVGLARRPSTDGRVLVVLQLTGGNDGLNTLVPHRQDAYFRLRPTLGIARGRLHALDDDHGLHPAMGGLAELFAEGKVAAIHGVGPPVPDRSHFRSLEVWHTAEPDAPAGDVGWLGRMADQLARRDPSSMVAAHVGDEDLPLAMWGEDYRSPTVRDPRGFRIERGGDVQEQLRRELASRSGGDANLAFLRDAARGAYEAATRMEELADAPSAATYPDTPLAKRLQLVARLVAGGFGTRVFQVTLGGFDTHARQAPVHEPLLTQLSGALTAFQRDLESTGADGRVTTLVFSEFGRRAAENASRGTDHGAGAPAFVVGGAVRGGLVGTPPDLERLVDGDVPSTVDFRRVYAALEKDWMRLRPSTPAEPLDLVS